MPVRIPVSTIGVSRDGKTVYPPIGKPFSFTAAEADEINALQKSSGVEIYRKPVNEAPANPENESGGQDLSKAPGDLVLSNLTVVQLKEEAARRQVDLGAATTKADIIAKLEAEDL